MSVIDVPSELLDFVVATRRDLHAHPELGFKEVRTSGIVAAKYRPHPYWDQMPLLWRYGMGLLLPALFTARPHFVAYATDNLPALAPAFARHTLCLPVLTWVVRSEAVRQRVRRFADQIIFEGFSA